MQDNNTANNKRIAKNTLVLYLRMLLLMFISLYTSRLVLATLGISDYGIYNVVGGFVGLFTMVSATMATATQRFLSMEIGKGGSSETISRIFSTSIIIHIYLALIILVLAETIGLWFVNNKMVFPIERLTAVNWVFQFSVLTLLINVLSVPYSASLVAYEKMSAFAYIGILEAILKLVVVYLIVVAGMDKLILYSLLLMLIAIGIRLLYSIYVQKHLTYCCFCWNIDREYRRSMLSFIGYNFIGSTANILKTQGINILLNIFFGTLVNAARGVSVSVLRAVSGFVTNFQMAMTPQIIKLYAAEQKEEMFKLMFRGSKCSYYLMLLISLPIIIETPFILNLWLVEVPEYTVIFVRLTLIYTMIDTLSNPLISGVHASGNVKRYQLINGSILMLTLPAIYIVLRLGFPPYMAFVVSLFFSLLCHFVRLFIVKSLIDFPMKRFLGAVTLRVFLVTVVSVILPLFFIIIKNDNFLFFILSCFVTFLSSLSCIYIIGLNQDEKEMICKFLKNKISSR